MHRDDDHLPPLGADGAVLLALQPAFVAIPVALEFGQGVLLEVRHADQVPRGEWSLEGLISIQEVPRTFPPVYAVVSPPVSSLPDTRGAQQSDGRAPDMAVMARILSLPGTAESIFAPSSLAP